MFYNWQELRPSSDYAGFGTVTKQVMHMRAEFHPARPPSCSNHYQTNLGVSI